MQHFISDISKSEFPVTEKVTGKSIRKCIMEEIIKEHPEFNDASLLSLSELGNYREQYIRNSLINELGEHTSVENQVLEHLKNNQIISDSFKEEALDHLSAGQKLADKVAVFGGSWNFIILFVIFIIIWMIINIFWLLAKGFHPYPFILLNLILSCLAAFQAPVIMMSQNRQEEKDRERAKNDYMVNLKSELEIRILHEKLDHLIVVQQEKLMEIQQIQIDMLNDIMQKMKK